MMLESELQLVSAFESKLKLELQRYFFNCSGTG